VRATKHLSLTASGGARLWQTQGDASTDTSSGLSEFGLHECQRAGGNVTCKLGQAVIDPTQSGLASFAQDPANRPTETTVDAYANLNGRYRFGSGDLALKGMLETGVRGNREGVDVSGEKRWDGGRYMTGARASVYGWDDPTRPDRDAVSFAYVLAAGFRPAQVSNMRVEFEHDMNRLVGMRYRVMGVLNLRVLK
jgi:hypothetical protein